MTDPPGPDWFALGLGVAGGLALFLFGLDQLSEGLKRAAGSSLKTLLTRLTANRVLGVIAGAAVTGILNSSTVTTVLVVSFVTAGVMTLAQSVPVIMGANIGSTITAQLLAFNISDYALLPVAAGGFLLLSSRRESLRSAGMMLMGIGLVFYGMGVMGEAMTPLRSHPPFVQALAAMASPLYGIAAGALFTAVVQSSAATVGLAITMATDGLLSLPAGIAVALGANIGTCATALIAAVGKPVEAMRAAAVHVAFNVLGVLLWLPFIGVLAAAAVAISPASPELEGTARLAAEVPRQMANANTVFNVTSTLIFLGFSGAFARLATRLVPGRADAASIGPRFLDEATLGVPAVALDQARREVASLGETVLAMLNALDRDGISDDRQALASMTMARRHGEGLETGILEFLARVRQQTLTQRESESHAALLTATLHFRSIADIVADDLMPTRTAGLSSQLAELHRVATRRLYQSVQRSVALVIEAVREWAPGAASDVEAMSFRLRRLAGELMSQLAESWTASGGRDLEALRLETALVNALQQIFSLTRRIARTITADTASGTAPARDHQEPPLRAVSKSLERADKGE